MSTELISKDDDVVEPRSIGAVAEASRSQAEIQAALIVAQNNPRDENRAIAKIMNACQRPGLAAKSSYLFSRGGTDVTGPNIRLLEVCASAWGNIQYGTRVLSQGANKSQCESFAWDVETNTKVVKPFIVKHERKTKRGNYPLTDDSDIYELIANMGSRRERACLEKVIPRDVVDDALDECSKTLKATVKITPELLKKLLHSMEEFGITKAQLEARYQRKFDKITPAQVVALRQIYASLNDGIAQPEDFFDPIDDDESTDKKQQQPEKGESSLTDKLKEKSQVDTPDDPAAAEETTSYKRWCKTIRSETDRVKLIEHAAEMDADESLADDEKAVLSKMITKSLKAMDSDSSD